MSHTLMIFITFDVPQLSMSQMPTVPSGSRCPMLLEKEAASSDGAKGQIIPFFQRNWNRESKVHLAINTFHVSGAIRH